MIPRRYAIRTVCQKTGLEESEIRYFETVFKEFLTFTRMGLDKQDFTDDHIELLCRYHFLPVGPLHRIICWYFKEVPGVKPFRDAITRAGTLEQMRALIDAFV